ncbi:hypothetical protein RRF57_010814 [Xylaria bambusicola]|uniref:Uncharacterized protein n=1 Tax=Xylaria bambusicola TaxID=326684 RepID=A0AAN7Z901_9PEZI
MACVLGQERENKGQTLIVHRRPSGPSYAGHGFAAFKRRDLGIAIGATRSRKAYEGGEVVVGNGGRLEDGSMNCWGCKDWKVQHTCFGVFWKSWGSRQSLPWHDIIRCNLSKLDRDTHYMENLCGRQLVLPRRSQQPVSIS